MISKILIATDGSKTAWKALEYAVELTKQIDATIIVLAVIDKSLFVTRSIPSMMTPTHIREPLEDYLRQVAETDFEKAERLFRKKGVRSRKVIRTGHPVEEILKEAQKSKADLIVVGSHGRSALQSAVLGSVAFGVIHKDTKIPVLVVRR